MIALLLAAQIAGAAPANPPPGVGTSLPFRSVDIIRSLPRKTACKGDPGRLEASLAVPAALYRHGDRPAKGLKNWIDYPNAAFCLVETGR
jgi:hypothetical protein